MIYVLTVKQLSDKLNVSKQTINNNVPNDMSYKKIKGINYIDSELEIAITNNIEKNKNRFSYDKNTKQSETTTTNGAASSNNELIKLLREQLEEWKTQTKDFSNKLAYQQKLVDQQQQLSIDQTAKISKLENELANKNKQLIELKNDNTENKNSNISEATYSVHSDTDINNNTEPKKKGLLSRLFNR